MTVKQSGHSPARHVLWRVAFLVLLVVNFAQGAAELAGLDAVQTHVELLAVLRVRELGVRYRLPVAVRLGLLRTLEPVLQLACRAHKYRITSLFFLDVSSHSFTRIPFCFFFCLHRTAQSV